MLLVQTERDVDALDLADDTPVAYVTQTTLSVDDTRGVIAALKRRFTDIVGPDTTTSATPPRTASRRCASWPRSPT